MKRHRVSLCQCGLAEYCEVEDVQLIQNEDSALIPPLLLT